MYRHNYYYLGACIFDNHENILTKFPYPHTHTYSLGSFVVIVKYSVVIQWSVTIHKSHITWSKQNYDSEVIYNIQVVLLTVYT